MIPALIAAAAMGGAGLAGVGGHLSAKKKNEKAQNILRQAQDMYDTAVESLEKAKNDTEKELLKLGYAKKNVLDSSIKQFLRAYDRVRDVQMRQSIGLDEVSKFSIDYEDAVQLRKMSDIYSDAFSSGATGVAAGIFGAAGAVLTSGILINPLASVVAPIVLFTGISASMKADENLEKAEQMKAEAEKAVEEMKVSETLCNAIAKRSKMFDELLTELGSMFSECADMLDTVTQDIVRRLGNETVTTEKLSQNELELIAVTRALAGAVKSVIDTPILTKDGNLTEKSLDVYNQTAKSLPDFNGLVERVKSYDYTVKVVENTPRNMYVSQKVLGQYDEKEKGENEGLPMSILSVLFGIISIITSGILIIPEVLGIVFACHGKRQGKMRGVAKVGLSFNIISIILLLAVTFLFIKMGGKGSVNQEVARDNALEISDQYEIEQSDMLQDIVTDKENNADINISNDKLQDIESVTGTEDNINGWNQDSAGTNISKDMQDIENVTETENDLNAWDQVGADLLWEDTYQRNGGPSSTVTILSLDDRGIIFSASIGTPGDAAYVDIRDGFAGWTDDSEAFYGGDRGYLLFFTLNDDGSLCLEDNYQPYMNSLSLTGEYTRESEANYPDCEFVFPDSEYHYISNKDCAGLTKLECKIARNEIYARHGRKFTDESLQAYFDACSWYEGIIEGDDFTEDALNEYELENLETITEYEEHL